MKRLLLFIGVICVIYSCEDVIDVSTPDTEPKLIVDGILRVDENEEFVPVEIKVTETDNFFGSPQPTQLENAVIFYGIPLENDPSLLEEIFRSSLAEVNPGSGVYVPDPNFSSDQRIRTSNVTSRTVFFLEISHEGRRYFARTPYVRTVPFDTIELGDETLFDDDETEIKITFTDFPNREDYYVFDFGFGEFLAVEDQFFDGQEFEFSYFYDQVFEQGQELEISILGADQTFFNYVDLLVEQTQEDGGVFQTPVATVRGNVFDVTGIDNINIFDNVERPNDFALGYFAVIQEFKETIIIE